MRLVRRAAAAMAPGMGARRPKPSSLDAARRTLAHYEAHAADFWQGTRHHDVAQNIDALLDALPRGRSLRILDLGCGPGRDLVSFRERGHEIVGLDGCGAFVEMARAHAGVEVLHQDFLKLILSPSRFDGVYANALLFHIPLRSLPRVLRELREGLRQGGALFCSNPRGDGREGWSGGRFGCFLDLEAWRELFLGAGFAEITHYYRPPGRPREDQPWLAMVWRRRE